MLKLAHLPALLIVTAGLAVLALRMLRQAQARGRSVVRWMVALLATWLGVLALAAFGTRAAYERHYHLAPGFWVVFVPAVVLAFVAALGLGWRLSRRPSLAAPEPAPEEPSTPAAPPPPRPTPPVPTPPPPPRPHETAIFKFACPHCGQRLAVTTADIGTTANCPNCEAAIEVPSPEAE